MAAQHRADRDVVLVVEVVAPFLLRLFKLLPITPDMLPQAINGGPGAVTMVDGALGNAVTFDVADDRITQIYIQVNPDKLEPLATALQAPLADWMALLPQRGNAVAT